MVVFLNHVQSYISTHRLKMLLKETEEIHIFGTKPVRIGTK
ncbi:hypothetical protein AOR13_1244 [Alteromonas stellipolaris LMG 21856]|nr:hypothetical protein AOR13_1244 [Alteromonas stellipolaris LMG 21856]